MKVPKTIQQFVIRLTIAAVVIGIAARLIWWPIQQTNKVINDQVSSVNNARQILTKNEKLLASVTDPAQVALGQPSTTKDYAENMLNISAQLAKVTVTLPGRMHNFLAIGPAKSLENNANALILDNNVSEAYKNAAGSVEDTQRLMDYHGHVMRALANVLDYDPARDFANFDPASQDTQDRLSRAKEGLSAAINNLNRFIDADLDPSSNELVEEIGLLQTERDRLKSGGSVEGWITVVQNSQKKIQSNRSEFWLANADSLKDKLKSLNKTLADVAVRWQKADSS